MAITRTDTTNERLNVGYKAHGWTLIQRYRTFNLWEREAKHYDGIKVQVNKIRECFYKNEVPNEHSMPRYAE